MANKLNGFNETRNEVSRIHRKSFISFWNREIKPIVVGHLDGIIEAMDKRDFPRVNQLMNEREIEYRRLTLSIYHMYKLVEHDINDKNIINILARGRNKVDYELSAHFWNDEKSEEENYLKLRTSLNSYVKIYPVKKYN